MTESNQILETTRLCLRKWTTDDREALFEILRNPEVVRYIADGKPFTIEKVIEFLNWAEKYELENGFSRWKVIEKSSGSVIGSCGFGRPHGTEEIELGYLLAQKHWGRGFATEIAGAVMLYGFKNLGFREIIALTDLENIASQKVLEKIGFTKCGVEIYDNQENLVYLAQKPENIL